ncbi:protein MutS [Seminavis robusta]|uniref:Protein MutS n=1 Tax=Seminavis robusta TaxID=568900 RepID=A0A9N8F237_9STRA|nr:protein MutS [Seminavis robusta]|eukprot:Sro2738_g335960.1 protein MutS (931) ;mRNA; r:4463-7701
MSSSQGSPSGGRSQAMNDENDESRHEREDRGGDDDDASTGRLNNNHNAPPLEPAMVCTCVVELGPRVCFATYNEDSNEIILEESVCSGKDFGVVAEKYFALLRPNLLLVSSKVVSNESFLEALTRPLSQLDLDGEEEEENNVTPLASRSIPYRVLKSGAFDSRTCMTLISQKLRVLSLLRKTQEGAAGQYYDPLYQDGNLPYYNSDNQRVFPVSSYHQLGTLINFNSEITVKCIGALLSFLQGTIFRTEADETVTVANITHAQTSKFMILGEGAIEALHIFATEHHPLMAAKGRGNSKEGSSIFSLLDRTCSKGGRQMLRNWMLKPLLNRDEILMRQDGVELFMDATMIDSESLMGLMSNLLNEIAPINQILQRLKKCATLPVDFVKLTRTLSAANEICGVLSNEIIGSLQAAMPDDETAAASEAAMYRRHKAGRYIFFVQHILERCNVQVLTSLQEHICSVVDEESTYECGSVCINTGFHQELDARKEEYDKLPGILLEARNQVMQKHPQLGHLIVLFYPQVGFLVGMTQQFAIDPATGMFSEALPSDFKYQFGKDAMYYFNNDDTAILNQTFGDLDGWIKDTEAMIISDLEDEILEQETELRETFLALSEMDCILAFAFVARERNYIRPTILPPPPPDSHSTTIVKIKRGRHPLQEILVEGRPFVANHVEIDDKKLVNVLTGPNFSGKSCYARKVGALVYMAHIGSFVPCDECVLSIVDQIFTQFARTETCAVPQSSFQLDLTQMGGIFSRCTPRSLVILDEFGKGTSPSSGIALLVSALRWFASKDVAVVCTTHFLEMFSRGYLTDGQNGINAMQMAVHIPDDTEDMATPLFRLQEGVASSSAGIICARMAGLDRRIVRRAKQIVASLKAGKPIEASLDLLKAEVESMPAAVKQALGYYFAVDWANATDEQVETLIEKFQALRQAHV